MGASPITTTEDLGYALTKAFNQRADDGREFLIAAFPPQFPYTGCHEALEEKADVLKGEIGNAISFGIELEN